MATPDDGPTAAGGGVGAGRKFWRSASWSASRAAAEPPSDGAAAPGGGGQARRVPPPPPLTPRSMSAKARSCLPPLQPLAITRRSLDEWPKAGSDDVGEWPNPTTPGASKVDGGPSSAKPGEGLRLDLSSLRSQGRKDQIAFFDKECSKVAEHVYLGGDAVAKNRDILRKNGITHVLNCVGFVCPEYFKSDLVYRTLWLQDSPTEDITSILYDVFDYFEDVREQGGRVFVHCCQGVSRSTSLVIAYLMWREGQSFDDAFQFVKAARGIANPNMGFACQLLQCQKRVHAIPLSPNSVLRMYRMAPHSQYAPLHLVPKMLNEPSPTALDSRGAFIVHVLSSIYVWVGMKCDPVMEKDARAAAHQVARYEKVQGNIKVVREGLEPQEFWDAFSSTPLNSDDNTKVSKGQIDSASKSDPGSRKVESYDADFELVYKAITGGVVPAFSTSGAGDETHLPARESSWSLLRHKFVSRSLARVYSDSALIRDFDPRVDRVQHLAAEASTSPPFLSPSSFSSDSSVSSKSPLSQSSNEEASKHGLESIRSPYKTSSIAERRGGFTFLKLPSLPPRVPSSIRRTEEVSDKSSTNGVKLTACSNAQLVVYQWPSMEKLTTFARKDLDPKSVFIFVASNASRREVDKMVYVWIGDENESSKSVDTVDWQKVTADCLLLKGLSDALPVKVFKEHETEKLLEVLNVS
ncbi:unnamed protein product [Urochloa humidicola]